MKRIEWALCRDGYRVLNIGYPSRRHDIATLANNAIGPVFANHSPSQPLHFVTHSMGGILLRQFLHDHPNAPELGRIVMLGPPNHGSEIVDHLRSWPPYAKLNGPAGLQLGTESESKPNQLTDLSHGEVGVIAGTVSLNPLFSLWLRRSSDGKVSVESTRLDGMTDHIVLRTSHTWMMWRGCVIDQIRAFLHNGRFIPTKYRPLNTVLPLPRLRSAT
jgi:pimeloyl-ACP methyl ester carboxylesterase